MENSLILQEKDNYCLCAIFKGILRDNGLNYSQDYIAQNLTLSKKGLFLAHGDKISNFFSNLGFFYDYHWHNEIPLGRLDKFLLRISENNGFFGLENHAYRIIDFEQPKIIVINPKKSNLEIFDYILLKENMKKKDGGFGLIKKLK